MSLEDKVDHLAHVIEQLRADLAGGGGMRATKDPDEEIDVKTYAAEHNISAAAVYKRVNAGQLACRRWGKNGRSIMIKRGAVCR